MESKVLSPAQIAEIKARTKLIHDFSGLLDEGTMELADNLDALIASHEALAEKNERLRDEIIRLRRKDSPQAAAKALIHSRRAAGTEAGT